MYDEPRKSRLSKVSVTSSKSYISYKYRFVTTILYSMVTVINAIMWICTSPITYNLEEVYGLQLFTVSFCTSVIWFVVYPPINFAANYVLDELGLRAGVFLGAILTIVGLWIRTLSTHSFYYIFAGQLLGALGQPFILNAPQKLSAVWYPPDERAMSTTVASIANPVGVGVGFIIAQNFVDNDAIGTHGLNQINNMMMFIAILGSVLIVPVFVLFRDKPKTPPSKAADTEKYHYKESLKHLFGNKNYIIFIISTGLVFGAYNITATVIQPLLQPFGFEQSETGDFGAITLVSGLIGSVVFGLYLDKTKKYKVSLLVCAIMSIISLGILVSILNLGSFLYSALGTALYGFFTTPILPIAFEFSGELSFPVAEAASSGLMVVMTQIGAVLGTTGVTALLSNNTKENSFYAYAVLGGLEILGLIGFMLTKEDLRRAKVEAGATIHEVEGGEDNNSEQGFAESVSERIEESSLEGNPSEVKSSLLLKTDRYS